MRRRKAIVTASAFFAREPARRGRQAGPGF